MGITTVSATISNLDHPRKKISDTFIVDTGAAYTVLPEKLAIRLGITPVKTQAFSLADGTSVTRKLGFALVEVDGEKAPSTVVIGEKDDSPLLGVITLENMGLMVDPFKRVLRPMKLMLAQLS